MRRRVATCLFAIGLIAMSAASRADTIRLYAAGSLRAALTEVAKSFEAKTGHGVQAKYGPSGVLRDELAGGAEADVFASANMEHPRALSMAKKSGSVVLFARNRLCALVRPDLAVTQASILDRMLDPQIRVGTSTPTADPSGDYAWQLFGKADKIRPGAYAILDKKTLQLTGGPSSPMPAPGRTLYGTLIDQGAADIFLTYCTNALAALKEYPSQQIVQFRDTLSVGADYGLTVMIGARVSAYTFALFILSSEGQQALAKAGFFAPNLPE
jgi:ABC-type molybdate transport system substrate-binding protein